jgi:hypothetical protein
MKHDPRFAPSRDAKEFHNPALIGFCRSTGIRSSELLLSGHHADVPDGRTAPVAVIIHFPVSQDLKVLEQLAQNARGRGVHARGEGILGALEVVLEDEMAARLDGILQPAQEERVSSAIRCPAASSSSPRNMLPPVWAAACSIKELCSVTSEPPIASNPRASTGKTVADASLSERRASSNSADEDTGGSRDSTD